MKLFKSTAPDEPRIITPNRFRVHQEIIHPLIMSESAILLTSTKYDTQSVSWLKKPIIPTTSIHASQTTAQLI
jgi:hypothetical protein